MKKISCGLFVLMMLLCPVTYASAQVSIGIGLPNLSIGINLPLYPELAPVPGYPVYYAPQVNANYFFYDGMYWVYQNDNWYASSWYNGPWAFVEPTVVPVFILRIPVRYYQQPPAYFRGWQSNVPPRWGQHWGNGWEQRRRGWDRWNQGSAPKRAPLPVYQRQYTGDRYPARVEQQQALRSQSYRYQPRDKVVRQHIQQQNVAAPAGRGREQDSQRSMPRQQVAPADQRSQQPQRGGEIQRPAPVQAAPQQRGPAVREPRQQSAPSQREQQAPRVQEQEQRQQERGQGRDKDEDRGRGRN